MSTAETHARLRRLAGAWKLWAGLAGLVVIMGWAAGCHQTRLPPGQVDAPLGRPLPEHARLLTLSNVWIHPLVQVVGTVASERTVHMSARLPAYIREIPVTAGQPVRQGDLLVTLDDRDVREQVKAAEARLGRAETEFARVARLLETGAATQRDYDVAEAALSATRAEVEQARVGLSDTRIVAPIDGIVIERRAEAGDLAAPGQVLMALYDPTVMRLEAHVPMHLLTHFAVGAEHAVELEYPAVRLRGSVTEQHGIIDPTSRTRTIKLALRRQTGDEGEPSPLVPGAFGRMRVAERPHEGIRIPVDAIHRVGQLETVEVVENDRRVRRLITTGVEAAEGIEVLTGLRAGETILL